jgi:hypothetical protein
MDRTDSSSVSAYRCYDARRRLADAQDSAHITASVGGAVVGAGLLARSPIIAVTGVALVGLAVWKERHAMQEARVMCALQPPTAKGVIVR